MKLAIHNEVAVSNDEVRQLDRACVSFMVDAGQSQPAGHRRGARLRAMGL